MKIDWTKMTAQEAWDALRVCPKVAGPWEDTGGGYSPCRRATDGTVVAVEGLWATPAHPVARWRVPVGTREDADDLLRKNGWLLV